MPCLSFPRGMLAKRLLEETLGGVRCGCLEHVRCTWGMRDSVLPQGIPGDGLPGRTRRAVWKDSPGAGGPAPLVGPSWDGLGGGTGNAPAEQGGSQHGWDKQHRNQWRG